jgi:hypothetical protein
MLSKKFDTAAIDSSIDLVALIGRNVALKRDGMHFKGLCPLHGERSPSLTVTPSKHVWKCFGCGAGGGAIEWMVQYGRMSFVEACKSLTEGAIGVETRADSNTYTEPLKAKPEAIFPIPDEAVKNRPERHPKHGIPNKTFIYRDQEKRILYFVHRWNKLNDDGSPDVNSDGKQRKEIIPQIYTNKGWKWLAPQAPRPIYGLDRLRPDAPVALFEGEKAADFAASHIKTSALSWQGGTGGVRYADWTPLAGRRVLLSRDNDLAGWKTMEWLGEHLETLGCEVLWLNPPSDAPKGWDVADHVPDSAKIVDWMKSRVAFNDRGQCPHVAEVTPPPVEPTKPKPTKPEPDAVILNDQPFTHLGYERTISGDVQFWYYVKARQLTLSMSAKGMSLSGLLTLAPLSWWEGAFPGRNGKLDNTAAQNMLILPRPTTVPGEKPAPRRTLGF